LVVSWVLRILLGVGGALLVYTSAPVTWGAWQALGAGTVVDRLREGKPIGTADAAAAVGALDRAVQADPGAYRHLARSELMAGLAAAMKGASDAERDKWLRTAEADLESGLAGEPGRGIAWLRLAGVRQALDGPSRRVIDPMLMSIAIAPVVPRLWPARLELILRNWDSFSEAERALISTYVAMTWQASSDRRWFVWALREPLDELMLRILLADQPGAQEELNVWMRLVRR
jgi:hypothetical protein